MFQKRTNSGLTILEVLASIAIFAMLATISISGLSSYRNNQVLNGELSQSLAILSRARTLTLASKAQTAYGVRINADRLILFPGPVFASSTPTNEEYVLHNAVNISDINLSGGGVDILFERLTGETASFGTFRIGLVSDATASHTVSVKGTGIVSQQQ